MSQMNPFIQRLIGVFTYWGLLKHPYGREYARQRYTPTGKFVEGDETSEPQRFQRLDPEPAED